MFKILSVSLFCAIALAAGADAQTCTPADAPSNGTTADATLLNNYLVCFAPLSSPSFTGNLGINAASSALTPLYVSGTELPAFTGTARGVVSVTGTYSAGYYIPIDFLYGDNEPPSARIAAYDDGSGSRLVFGTSNHYAGGITNAALTIDSVGHVNIGASTSSYSLYVNGTSAGTSAFTNLSDVRLKKNIVPIAGALAIIEQLQGVRFEWREPQERTVGKEFNLANGSPQIGFIAQDVKKVLPEAVSTSHDGQAILSMQESKIVPVLVQAVKEQAVQIEQLRRDIAALKQQKAAQITHPKVKLASGLN